MTGYNPYDWYWQASDGRIFSSKKQALVPDDDADFVVWKGINLPSHWPHDEAGDETDDALQAVLDPYHTIFVTLEAYAANQRWQSETAGITSSAGVPLKTDDRSKTMMVGAGLAAQNDNTFTTTWVGADDQLYPMDATQLVAQVADLLRHINACFAAYTDAINGLKTKKITTRKQIDELFAKARKG